MVCNTTAVDIVLRRLLESDNSFLFQWCTSFQSLLDICEPQRVYGYLFLLYILLFSLLLEQLGGSLLVVAGNMLVALSV